MLKPIPHYPNKFENQTINYCKMGTSMPVIKGNLIFPNCCENNNNFVSFPFFQKQSNYPQFNQYPTLIQLENGLLINPDVKNTNNNRYISNKKEFIKINKDIKQKEINKLLNKKRIAVNNNQLKNNDIIKNNNLNKNNKKANKLTIEKKYPKKAISKMSSKKNMFTIYKKSKYKRRKKRIKKSLNIKIKCGHEGCNGIFYTKKHLAFHHYKMSNECHKDSLTLLKMITSVKKILLKVSDNKNGRIIENYRIEYGSKFNY